MSFRMLNMTGRRAPYGKGLVQAISVVMFDDSRQPNPNEMPATHTYLGQMLSHELVPKTNGTGRDAKAKLTLASLYGDPVDLTLFDDNGLFITGVDDQNNPESDLPRSKNNTPDIPEDRNDENLLISQMHLFWMRVHNKIVREHIIQKGLKWRKEEVVYEARKQLLYFFHRVVVEDFLGQLLLDKTHNVYFDKQQQYLLKGSREERVPFEFSMACFRLGHSLVRPTYELQKGRGAKHLRDLLRHTNQLPVKHYQVVNWKHFATQDAHKIDSVLAPAMGKIPCLPNKSVCMGHTQIIEANLKAGTDNSLPYPQDVIDALVDDNAPVAAALGINKEIYQKMNSNMPILRLDDFPKKKVPMWLFVLFEAQMDGMAGNRLGKFGGMMVAEVFSHCIRQTPGGWFDYKNNLIQPPFPNALNKLEKLTLNDVISWLQKN